MLLEAGTRRCKSERFGSQNGKKGKLQPSRGTSQHPWLLDSKAHFVSSLFHAAQSGQPRGARISDRSHGKMVGTSNHPAHNRSIELPIEPPLRSLDHSSYALYTVWTSLDMTLPGTLCKTLTSALARTTILQRQGTS